MSGIVIRHDPRDAPKPVVTQSPNPHTDVAFVLSLVGAVLISIGSVVGIGMGAVERPTFWGMGGMTEGYGMNSE